MLVSHGDGGDHDGDGVPRYGGLHGGDLHIHLRILHDIHLDTLADTLADTHTRADTPHKVGTVGERTMADSSLGEGARTSDDPPCPIRLPVTEHTHIPFRHRNVLLQAHGLASLRASVPYACRSSQGLSSR
jgi:hypothetical protein